MLGTVLCCRATQVKVLASDGAQTQIDMSFGSASLSTLQMTATYSYYLRRTILQAREFHSIPVVRQPPRQPTAAQGQQLLSQPTPLDALAQQVRIMHATGYMSGLNDPPICSSQGSGLWSLPQQPCM